MNFSILTRLATVAFILAMAALVVWVAQQVFFKEEVVDTPAEWSNISLTQEALKEAAPAATEADQAVGTAPTKGLDFTSALPAPAASDPAATDLSASAPADTASGASAGVVPMQTLAAPVTGSPTPPAVPNDARVRVPAPPAQDKLNGQPIPRP